MDRKISLKQALTAWDHSALFSQDHLKARRLYEIARIGGIQSATPLEQAHLSLCPECLEYLWLFSLTDEALADTEDEDEYPVMGYGFLKAAAAEDFEPVETKSSCGYFVLSIFPELDSPDRGMAVLAAAWETDRYNGLQASVRDAKGAVILKSKILQGRAAVKVEDLDRLDLSEWTVILSKPERRSPHE